MGKGKLVAGLIILVIGVGLISGGFGLDKLIDRRMDESITTSLNLIGIDAVPYARELVLTEITPEALLALKDRAEMMLPALINSSVASKSMKAVIVNLTYYIGSVNAYDWFFNDPAWTVNTDGNYSIQGISEFTGIGDLGFNSTGISRTKDKLFENQTTGDGVIAYFDQYYSVLDFEAQYPGNTSARIQMEIRYSSTFLQIESIVNYFIDHLFSLVGTLGNLPYGNVDATTVAHYFYMQWVNTTIVPNKWLIKFNETVIDRWEYKKFNLNDTQADAVWDPTNPLSPVNDSGILVWEDSLTNTTLKEDLKLEFSLDNTQLDNLQNYYFTDNNREKIVGYVIAEIRGRSVSDLANDKFYEHWVTGAVLPYHMVELNPEYENFELDTTGIGVEEARELWTPNTLNSIRNLTGVKIWLNLAREPIPSDSETYNELRDQFGLTNGQMDLLLDWILVFREVSVDITFVEQELPFHPYAMKTMVKTGSFITGGIVGFIGLMLLLGALKKKR